MTQRRRLGQGAYGTVWADDAAQTAEKTYEVAIKGDGTLASDILREIDALQRLAPCRDVPRLLAWSVDPARCFLQMELASRDLQAMVDALGGAAFGTDAVAAVVGAVTRALHAGLGGCGLVHGDVKAANVLRHADGRWLLTDWGIAVAVDRIAFVGLPHAQTRYYRAPELLLHELGCKTRSSNPRTMDVWSVGVLAVVMLGLQRFVCGASSPLQLRCCVRLARPSRADLDVLGGRWPFADYDRDVADNAFAAELDRRCPCPLLRDLVRRCLTFNSWQRITLDGILRHPFLAAASAADVGGSGGHETHPDCGDAAAPVADDGPRCPLGQRNRLIVLTWVWELWTQYAQGSLGADFTIQLLHRWLARPTCTVVTATAQAAASAAVVVVRKLLHLDAPTTADVLDATADTVRATTLAEWERRLVDEVGGRLLPSRSPLVALGDDAYRRTCYLAECCLRPRPDASATRYDAIRTRAAASSLAVLTALAADDQAMAQWIVDNAAPPEGRTFPLASMVARGISWYDADGVASGPPPVPTPSEIEHERS
jgi:serine/threonine protein kinase